MNHPTNKPADPVSVLRDKITAARAALHDLFIAGADTKEAHDNHWALVEFIDAAERAAIQPAGEAVHQWRMRTPDNNASWHDASKEWAYERVDGNYEARTLYTAAQQADKAGQSEALRLAESALKKNGFKKLDDIWIPLAARPPVTTTQCADEGAVRICPEYDRECGEFKRGWCDTCPKHMSISDPEMSVWRESVEGITISARPPIAEPTLVRQAVATVVSRVGDDLRVGWLRPERCDVGTLLYCAPSNSHQLAANSHQPAPDSHQPDRAPSIDSATEDRSLAIDAARWRYLEDHASAKGGGNGFTISCFIPFDCEDMGCGVDLAIAAMKGDG